MKKFLVQMTDAIKSLIGFARSADNVATTDSILALKTGIDNANAQVALIDELAAQQEQIITGYASAKANQKKLVALRTMTVAGPARGYFLNSGNTVMSNQLNISYSKLFKMKDGLLGGFCMELYTIIAPLQADLVSYGVSNDMLEQWADSINTYKTLVSNPRVAISNRKVETGDLDTMVIALNEFCRTTLTSIVEVLRETNPNYYKNFHVNMKQIVRGHRYTRLECVCTMGDSGAVVPNAVVSVDGTTLHATTDAQGMCTIAPIPRKGKMISVVAAGYVPINNMPVDFVNGQTSSVTIPMQMEVNITNNNTTPEKVSLN